MKKKSLLHTAILTSVLALAGCNEKDATTDSATAAEAVAEVALTSGIEKTGMDTEIKPQDDFYEYMNGTWLATTEIPEKYSRYGAFTILHEKSQENQKIIIEELAAKATEAGSVEQKVGDFYAAYMDTETIEKVGIKPLESGLASVAAVSNVEELIAQMGTFITESVDVPFGMGIYQDLKDSSKYTAYVGQSGLGLPDRDYYLDADNERFKKALDAYPGYIAQLFTLAGISDAEEKAAAIVELETKLAEIQWSNVENRNPEKIYNPYNKAALNELTNAVIDWPTLMTALQIGQLDELIVSQPSYFEALTGLLTEDMLATWKDYLSFKLLSASSPYLTQAFVDARFDFYGRVLGGQTQQQERWRKGINLTNGALGEALGRVYVEKHFPVEAKTRMSELVDNLLAEFAVGIDSLEWMSEETKKAAHGKLSTFKVKIGYPDKWKDYSSLPVTKDSLIDNVRASNQFAYAYEVNKLGKPIDKDEWYMTPQTVNAYYNPVMNEIVFPAAILQPPFFDLEADDAVNYGAIGMVIGHEISHGFDDQGSKFDGDGNLRNWWTDEDREHFEERAQKLIDQYNAYSPIEGMNVNGELTLGENIADLSGATVSYKAYIRSLGGKPAPVMDGYTGEQRFFLGLAQAWRTKYRDEALAARLASDPHSPPRYRVNGVVPNMDPFYSAFDVKEEHALFLAPEKRVTIW